MKTLDYYRRLPYRRRVRIQKEDSGDVYFIAFIEELPSVESDGDTPIEALQGLQAAFDDYIEAALEWGTEIPEPVRWPASLGLESAEGIPPGSVSVAAIRPVLVDRPAVPEEGLEFSFRTEENRLETVG